jgi:hypothetical protein
VVRVDEEETVSVVPAMTDAAGDDEAVNVGLDKVSIRGSSVAESAGEVGVEPNSVAIVQPSV